MPTAPAIDTPIDSIYFNEVSVGDRKTRERNMVSYESVPVELAAIGWLVSHESLSVSLGDSGGTIAPFGSFLYEIQFAPSSVGEVFGTYQLYFPLPFDFLVNINVFGFGVSAGGFSPDPNNLVHAYSPLVVQDVPVVPITSNDMLMGLGVIRLQERKWVGKRGLFGLTKESLARWYQEIIPVRGLHTHTMGAWQGGEFVMPSESNKLYFYLTTVRHHRMGDTIEAQCTCPDYESSYIWSQHTGQPMWHCKHVMAAIFMLAGYRTDRPTHAFTTVPDRWLSVLGFPFPTNPTERSPGAPTALDQTGIRKWFTREEIEGANPDVYRFGHSEFLGYYFDVVGNLELMRTERESVTNWLMTRPAYVDTRNVYPTALIDGTIFA